MKKTLKLTYVFVLALVLTTFSCNNDDEGTVIPEKSVQNLSVTIDENPTNGQVIGTVQVTGGGTSNYSITSQTPAGALNINASTGELTVADATIFDFETNPEITATISVVGAANTGTVTINLSDLNEISLQDVTVAFDENPTNGDAVGSVQVDGDGPFTFSIASQSPAGALDINTSTGELTVADAALFDFEANPVITATISVGGAANTSAVTIDLNDLDEINAQDLTVAIDENPIDGQVVGSIQVDGGGTLSFSITSQTPAGALVINTSTGELTVVDPNLFDFETNPILTATVSVDNSVSTSTAIVTINLTDEDEITVQDSTITFDENPTDGDAVGSIQASSGGSLNFAITFQNPAGAVEINASTGELTVADANLFDFETNPNMYVVVSVDNAIETVSTNASINLNNVNEIGDFNYGGVIFWVDPTDNNKGLVCAVNDQAIAIWGCETVDITGANDTSIGAGATNTAAIESLCTTTGTAADIVSNLSLNGHDDWFLPSKDELFQVYLNRNAINTTAVANGGSDINGNDSHWSSTQFSNIINVAFFQSFSNGSQNGTNKTGTLKVRAVRAFVQDL